MKTILIVGATRNLGKALTRHYLSEPNTTVYATARYGKPLHHNSNIHWISGIDISNENAGQTLALHYNHDSPVDIVYIVATGSHSLFVPESLDKLDFDKELDMYKTCAVGPLFLVRHLVKTNVLGKDSKVIFIGGEPGSISLRSEGGNYGFHGSHAALNMIMRLLSLDLLSKDMPVGVVYPGRIRLEGERRHVGEGDEVAPEIAAKTLASFVENNFNLHMTGQLWALRYLKSISELGTAFLEDAGIDRLAIQLPL